MSMKLSSRGDINADNPCQAAWKWASHAMTPNTGSITFSLRSS
ncbi:MULTISPECIES: hypothetical protein [Bacteroides]|nr:MULTISPECIES: hypothetical protein [Bacteroides]UVQ09680.1 hypothetical protein NXW81_19820 [Bacteroides xylanisolvens]